MHHTRSTDTTTSSAALVDAEWTRAWGCWVVSSTYRGHWTLVGLFEDSAPAFRAARQASECFGGADVGGDAGA